MHRKVFGVSTLALVALALVLVVALAQPGDLDPTWGTDGVSTVNITGSDDPITTMVLDADRKVTMAGWVNGYPGDFGVARLLQNGRLDQSFGNGGTVATRLTTDPDMPNAPWTMGQRANGGYVVSGDICDPDYIVCEWGTAVYLPDGSLDTSFSDDGMVIVDMDDVFTIYSWPYRLVTQADGGTVIGGVVIQNDLDVDIALHRYRADGTLDPAYGDNGIAVYDFDDTSNYMESMRPMPGNKILITGGFGESIDVFTYESDLGYLALFNDDGSLDTAFGTGGYVTWDQNGDPIGPEDLVIGPAGDIYVTGVIVDPDGDSDCAVWRFDAQGNQDKAFGIDGMLRIDLGQLEVCTSIDMLPDGKLGITGPIFPVSDETRTAGATYQQRGHRLSTATNRSADVGDNVAGLVARLNPDGSLDGAFGNGGIIISETQGTDNISLIIAAQPDGKLVTGGDLTDPSKEAQSMVVKRFLGDLPALANPGASDPTWGDEGLTLTDFGGFDDLANSNILMPDGTWVIVGWVDSFPGDFGVARYRSNGRLDPSFGDGGKVVTAFTDDPDLVDAAWATVARPNGGVFAIGDTCDADYIVCDIAVAAYLADGSLDESFGDDGLVTTDSGRFSTLAWPPSAILQPDGKLVVGGVAINDDESVDQVLVRYNTDGSLDDTFGTGGITIEDLGGADSFPQDMIALPGDKMVIIGTFGAYIDALGSEADAGYIARFNSDGSLDPTFGGGDGLATWDNGGAPTWGRWGLLTPDNMLLALGNRDIGPDQDCTLRRYDIDGNLDTTFGDGGQVVIDVGQNDECLKMTLIPDNKLVIIGPSVPVENAEMVAGEPARSAARSSALRRGSTPRQTPSARSGQADPYSNFVARYNLDGTPDGTFGEDGLVRYNILDGAGTTYNVAVQNDGKILLAGDVLVGDFFDFFTTRLLGDGPAAQVYAPVIRR